MPAKKPHPAVKPGLHPRNRHRARYDFPALIASHPPLADFVRDNEWGDASVDFADPAAVKALNAALLAHHYAIRAWDIPPGYLCPPIPGRADYLHHLADLLASCNGGTLPQGAGVRGLDVGCGANLIYPLLGHALHGWRFIGTELDAAALANAENILGANPEFAAAIELRAQHDAADILAGALYADEIIDFTLCNPPFHTSAAEAAAGSQRKLRNLGRATADAPRLNFGGQAGELWCAGGEREFIRRMIVQSEALADNVLWFTSLVSSQEHLPVLRHWVERSGARQCRTLEMAQGQKISRALAWSFHSPAEAARWAAARWQ